VIKRLASRRLRPSARLANVKATKKLTASHFEQYSIPDKLSQLKITVLANTAWIAYAV